MEDGKRPYIHKEEVRGMYISIEEIESNEHRKRIESLELVEIIRILKDLCGFKFSSSKVLKLVNDHVFMEFDRQTISHLRNFA
jgi:hypothetical protein